MTPERKRARNILLFPIWISQFWLPYFPAIGSSYRRFVIYIRTVATFSRCLNLPIPPFLLKAPRCFLRLYICKRPKVIQNRVITKLDAKHASLHGITMLAISYRTTCTSSSTISTTDVLQLHMTQLCDLHCGFSRNAVQLAGRIAL